MKSAPGLCVKASPINGKGCFAVIGFKRRRKIAEYTGELITSAEGARRLRRRRLHRVCAIDDVWSIDGAIGGNGTHYINHSCEPNAYIKVMHGHIIFFARRDILPGEEITLDYVSTYHSDRKRCSCKSPACRGTINQRMKAEG